MRGRISQTVVAVAANTAVRTSAETGNVEAVVPVGAAPGRGRGRGLVWVVSRGDGTLSEIDPGTKGQSFQGSRPPPAATARIITEPRAVSQSFHLL